MDAVLRGGPSSGAASGRARGKSVAPAARDAGEDFAVGPLVVRQAAVPVFRCRRPARASRTCRTCRPGRTRRSGRPALSKDSSSVSRTPTVMSRPRPGSAAVNGRGVADRRRRELLPMHVRGRPAQKRRRFGNGRDHRVRPADVNVCAERLRAQDRLRRQAAALLRDVKLRVRPVFRADRVAERPVPAAPKGVMQFIRLPQRLQRRHLRQKRRDADAARNQHVLFRVAGQRKIVVRRADLQRVAYRNPLVHEDSEPPLERLRVRPPDGDLIELASRPASRSSE